MKKIITDSAVEEFENYLRFEEKSENTIQKYIRDVRFLREFASAREISKTLAIEFKAYLAEKYELSSSNSMIAAVNAFFRFLGWGELCIKQFKIQRKAFCSEERELTKDEYFRLVNTAKQRGTSD